MLAARTSTDTDIGTPVATVEIFDPAMCCSTGGCGTDVDPTLARFAADVDWLAAQGVMVQRATLAQEPGTFVANEPVRTSLEALAGPSWLSGS